MDQDRWKSINRIFHAALDVEPSQRRLVVTSESKGDSELQAEVDQLLQADAEAGSYLEVPLGLHPLLLSPISSVTAGDVLCNRFRIVREIAEGGMGRVFEAFDLELEVPVAVKVLRPEIAFNQEAIARFRQEVRLAREITHPNICRTFDLERETCLRNNESVELMFLTMEFLSGETLASYIKQVGSLPHSVALDIARQIASALQTLHSLGVTHRDIKPGNVMLVKRDSPLHGFRAVITDFGLARLDPLNLADGHSALTQAGQPIGTLAYMAPEQLEGAVVSPATDIYAFGLILYEMITGKRAFPSDDLLGGIGQRLHGSEPLQQFLSRDIPQSWRHALEACLEIKPSNRPPEANDVVRILEGDTKRISAPNRNVSNVFRRVQVRDVAFTGTFLIALALFSVVPRLYRSRMTSQVAQGTLVYLPDLQNRTSEASLSNVGELIQAGLSQSSQINLLETGRVGDILQQMTKLPDHPIDVSTAREIAMRSGAARVIFVTITELKGKYSLDIDIQQPDNTPIRYRNHWAKRFDWEASPLSASSTAISPELLSIVRSASNWIRHEVGESANDIARLDTPPEDATTGDWRALAEYVNAEKFQSQFRTADAIDALHNAVRFDPAFSLAYARAGDLLISANRSIEGYQEYKRALDTDSQRRLTRHEFDRIRGIFALDTWDFAAAEEQFRDMTIYYENDYLGWFYRASALLNLGRTAEAVRSMERAAALHPEGASVPANMAMFYLIAGDRASAEKWIKHLVDEGHVEEAALLKAQVHFLDQNITLAKHDLEPLRSSSHKHIASLAFLMLAHLQAEADEDEPAIETLAAGIQDAKSSGDSAGQAQMLSDRGFLYCRIRDYGKCVRDVEAALALNDGPKAIIISSAILGGSLPNAPKEYSSAMHQILINNEHKVQLDLGPLFRLAHIQSRAELMLSGGHCRVALQEFRRAEILDSASGAREYLGRANSICLKKGSSDADQAEMRKEAAAAYARGAFQQPRLLFELTYHPPGFYADELTSWLIQARQLRPLDPRITSVTRMLQNLRPNTRAYSGRPSDVAH